ncbi:Protein of unknown function [Bacillus cytotoxicus]|nr:Protein of unknown function [Bacillus cytotoxicus]
MTILCKQFMHVIDDKRYMQDIISLWNDNCLQTAECKLGENVRIKAKG